MCRPASGMVILLVLITLLATFSGSSVSAQTRQEGIQIPNPGRICGAKYASANNPLRLVKAPMSGRQGGPLGGNRADRSGACRHHPDQKRRQRHADHRHRG